MLLKNYICKIYEEKTIEVGVFIDRHLYKLMEEVLKQLLSLLFCKRITRQRRMHVGCWQYLSWWQLQALKTQDEGRVKEQLLKMVHSLFLQVFIIYLPLEDFHNIFTPGGSDMDTTSTIHA